MEGILNLKKNDILDLTKKDPSINKIRLCAGWDVVKKGFFNFGAKDFDLDLTALLLDENNHVLKNKGLIYYGEQKGIGIMLHGDNLTGSGDGDDEKITVVLNQIPVECKKIIFAAVIYEAEARNQVFGRVKNAYVRLVDEDKSDKEICRYNLSEDGGNNTGIIFAELSKQGNEWSFKAVGELFRGSIQTLVNSYK